MSVAGASALRKRTCVEDSEGYRVSDGLCFFFEKVFQRVDRARAAVQFERLLARASSELLSEEWLGSFVSCFRERMCVDKLRVFDKDVRPVLVKPELIGRELFLP